MDNFMLIEKCKFILVIKLIKFKRNESMILLALENVFNIL